MCRWYLLPTDTQLAYTTMFFIWVFTLHKHLNNKFFKEKRKQFSADTKSEHDIFAVGFIHCSLTLY